MKKFSLLLMAVLLPGLSIAQESYFRFSVGYGLPAASEVLGSNYTSTNSSTGAYNTTREGIYGTLGSGLVFNASYGHMYTKNFGMDLALQYLSGKKYESSSTSTGSGTSSSSSTSSLSADGFIFRPSFVMTAGEGNIRPYFKAGVSLGLLQAASDSHNNSVFTTGTPQTSETRSEFTGGISFGYHGALGLDFGVSKSVNFFTEVMLTSLTYYPDQGEMTLSRVNNVDQPKPYSKVVFKESVTTSSTTAPPAPGTATETLQMSLPLSSISINAGIRILLKPKG